MAQDNKISNVPEITFANKQIVSRELGLGIPVSEASYIAAPNSIKIVEEEGEISGTVKKYYWTPLSSYLFDIQKSLNDIKASIATLTEVLTHA